MDSELMTVMDSDGVVVAVVTEHEPREILIHGNVGAVREKLLGIAVVLESHSRHERV